MSAPALRRLLHASTAAIALLGSLVSWPGVRLLLVAVAAGAVLFDAVRLSVPRVGTALRAVSMYRDREHIRPSGAMWLAVGYGLAALFPETAAAPGIVVGAVADPAAAWIGSLRGLPGSKTWRGSLAHFLVAAVALASFGFPVSTIVAGAAVGTALERWSGFVDDNLLIAPGVALTLTLLA